eukprot:PITA_31232
MNRKNWEEKLKDALWAYRITWKDTTRFTPYQLVYDKEVMLPIEFQIHTFKLAADLQIDLDQAQKERIQQLNQLDEMRQQAEETTILMQKQRKQWHDAHIKKKQFKEGLFTLAYNPVASTVRTEGSERHPVSTPTKLHDSRPSITLDTKGATLSGNKSKLPC